MRCKHNNKQYAYVRANKLVRHSLKENIKLSIKEIIFINFNYNNCIITIVIFFFFN